MITKEMLEHFYNRTYCHIELVKKYAKIISDKFGKFKYLPIEASKHDESKFIEPERTPYIYINWSYKLKDEGKKFEVSDDIRDDMNNATFHHIRHNRHHPEFWADNAELNLRDRDAVTSKTMDCTRMPNIAIADMCSDWMAMSEEKGTDPIEWADKNINKRWHFDDEQIELIYDIINKCYYNKDNKLSEVINKVDECICNLESSLKEDKFRDITRWEEIAGIDNLEEVLKLSENDGNNVIKDISRYVLDEVLKEIKVNIEKGNRDFSSIQVDKEVINRGVEGISKYIVKTYGRANGTIEKGIVIDSERLKDWALRKSKLIIQKMTVDMINRVGNILLDEEIIKHV